MRSKYCCHRRYKELRKSVKEINIKEVKKALYNRNFIDSTRKISPLQKHPDAVVVNSGKLDKKAMVAKMSKHVEKILKTSMKTETEQELKNTNPLYKEFQNLLDQDFKDRKLKENEIIKATVTEITKNFIVVDCKAKMEGMIPIDEFKNDDELTNLKLDLK